MTEASINPSHLCRRAFIYVRQSTQTQVQRNRESTRRQYELADRARSLGWSPDQVEIIDEDLGQSGASSAERTGFARLMAEVALGQAGIVLGLEVSRLARNNADWYRLLDLCGLTDTLIGDADGIYHPRQHNDRLILGLKGTFSEIELHAFRTRLLEGLRHKAARGELHIPLPVGYVWGEAPGEVRLDPDEEVVRALRNVFARFAELGAARRVWLWFLEEGLCLPARQPGGGPLRWVRPSYAAVRQVLTNPVYAGAYVFGKTRTERSLDADGVLRRRRVLIEDRSEWQVFLPDHHEGYVDWETYEANLERLEANRPQHLRQAGGAVREGSALLQGLAACGRCGRRMYTQYRDGGSNPDYVCTGGNRATRSCMCIAGTQIDRALERAVLEALRPAGVAAALQAAEQMEAGQDTALEQLRLGEERAAYEASRAERAYRAVDPENRLVARGLEREWERCLGNLAEAREAVAARERTCRAAPSAAEREAVLALGEDLPRVWHAETTTVRDRKELLRELLEEVVIDLPGDGERIHLVLRWRGGLRSKLEFERRRGRPAPLRTEEETVELVRRLATHYPDRQISAILNRQGRSTVKGLRFTRNRVAVLRTSWGIPCYQAPEHPPPGDLVTVAEAARDLGIAASTIHRWLNAGFIAGEQLTPGAPWQIRMSDALRSRFVDEAPPGYIPMQDATRRLGVSRQTVLQWVKNGKLEAVHVYRGRRKGLRIRVLEDNPSLFDGVA